MESMAGDVMDRASVARWLADYISAWEANDPDLIRALFSEDAIYRYHPYDEPIVGADAIAASWLEDPDEPGSWSAQYEPVAVDGDVAVAVGTSRYRGEQGVPERTYHNCFVVRFDRGGRCRQFTEWYVKQPG